MTTSLGTYIRAFDHRVSPAVAAGNYKNTVATLIAKGVVGFLTAGIGLGIICLIEHYTNVVPKIREFARNSKHIYPAILRAGESNVIRIELEDGRSLKLDQVERINTEERIYGVGFSMEGEDRVVLWNMTFDSMARSIRQDYVGNPGLYDYVFGPVAERASTLINIEGGQIPAPGLVSVMEKIENRLFWVKIPNNKQDLRNLLASAFWRVTGRQLNEDIEVDIPPEKTRGLDSTSVSPIIFNRMFERIVDGSGLPERSTT